MKVKVDHVHSIDANIDRSMLRMASKIATLGYKIAFTQYRDVYKAPDMHEDKRL